jgi:hypothetical protein
MENRTCKHCKKTFECVGRIFSNHVRWCDKNPNQSEKGNIAQNKNKHLDDILGVKKSFVVDCFNCHEKISVVEREKQFPKKEKYFCNRSCANSRNHSKETKNKISSSLQGRKTERQERQERLCLECNKKFEVIETSAKKFCSSKCSAISRRSSNEFLAYRSNCKFNFNVWDYPDEFNLNLIYKHGWYKAKNRGDNLNGVSRDHKISIRFGWENGIDPEIMKHPSNCELMSHPDNIGKNKKCSLLLEQLKKDIKKWDVKYMGS